jgi:hypothetical protein
VAALQAADASFLAGNLDLSELHNLLTELLQEQLSSVGAPAAAAAGPAIP